jgi:hypothetical protein
VEYEIGMVVKAIAGRDSGSFFVITAAEGEYVYIADGKTRKLNKPKRKNKKHIRRTLTGIDMLRLTDKRLRRELAGFIHREHNFCVPVTDEEVLQEVDFV